MIGRKNKRAPNRQELEEFKKAIEDNRYDFAALAYVIFPFGQKGHDLEHMEPYDWQLEEWDKLSKHLMNPLTRYHTYRLIISSGNGAAKTAFGAMTVIMLMYTQQLQCRVTANTDPQMKQIVWPEYDVWFRHARYSDQFFEKLGTSIKALDETVSSKWRIDTVNWSEQSPAAISGLHNKGKAVAYVFEEAPGIPAKIWQYASGAFTETDTIKIWLAFGNSDDPESKFEQNMSSPTWRSLRIDTRTLSHIDPQQIADWLLDAGGDEDNDDFRVRVRGLPRKSAKDSIIGAGVIEKALERRLNFDKGQVTSLPCVLACDPAWKGGDETTIWYKQGHYACMLEKFKLKNVGQDHRYTYNRLCYWERVVKADAVNIDQGEGTAVWTLANADGKYWELVSFGSAATDTASFAESEFGNIRAMMYYYGRDFLKNGGILDAKGSSDEEIKTNIDIIRKQLSWTKGKRHKVHGKKMAEPKLEIKERVGQSPDVADGFVLLFARPVNERLPENNVNGDYGFDTGQTSYSMPDHGDPYDDLEADYHELYD
jgi:hypothetical protein